MRTAITALSVLTLMSTPAMSQVAGLSGDVRPGDCRPVFPVTDQTAALPQQDVVSNPAGPASAVAKRRFFGLPFLLPLLLAGGGCIVACGGGGGGGGSRSPA